MVLYFQHSDKKQDIVCPVSNIDEAICKALDDLKVRAPHFKSYYQRVWRDDNKWVWIDVGDWSCFYIIKPEEADEVQTLDAG